MSERRVSQIVRQAHRFNKVAVDMKIITQRRAPRAKENTDRAPDLRDLHGVRQSRAIEIILSGEKHLSLGL